MTEAQERGIETVIGLEVHAQLLTQSKMYCGCSARYADAAPNTHVCPVCLGLPGALPVLNRAAIEAALLTGVALSCEIPGFCKLDRKNYVYPDLPKGYQISQYDLPLCANGSLTFMSGDSPVTAGITRVHVEEDTGRLVHRSQGGVEVSLVDLNRSGVPLMEIVGEPDLTSPEAARDYLVALRQILRYIGVSTGNMEEGAFRCDANISVRHPGDPLGSKVEVKNMNSFRSVERALRFEQERQLAMLAAGTPIAQETRGWDEARGVTVSQRTKEQAHDYRYFPEPDIPPLTVSSDLVSTVTGRLPELPLARRQRLIAGFSLNDADVAILTAEREVADAFEQSLGDAPAPARARATANWMVNDVIGLQKERGLPPQELPITPMQVRELVELVESGELTGRAAKELLPALAADESPRAAATRLNLLALDDSGAINEAIVATMAAFPAAVADFQNGKQAAIGRLIGETIKRTGGRAKPDQVRELLIAALTPDA